MDSTDIEIAVFNHFNASGCLVVPNVWHGMGLNYEADVVVLRRSGYAIEVEIKISAGDIRADLKKRHRHDSPLFKELWFAVPEKLADNPNIPEQAGILAIRPQSIKRTWYAPLSNAPKLPDRHNCYAHVLRDPARRKDCVKWTVVQRQKLAELGCMRIWGVKKKLKKLDAYSWLPFIEACNEHA